MKRKGSLKGSQLHDVELLLLRYYRVDRGRQQRVGFADFGAHGALRGGLELCAGSGGDSVRWGFVVVSFRVFLFSLVSRGKGTGVGVGVTDSFLNILTQVCVVFKAVL